MKKTIEGKRRDIKMNEVLNDIRDWFVDNRDAILDSAMKVARDGFIESSVDDFIDEVDLDFIVEDIVDEIQKGIINVLDTYIEENTLNDD